MEVGRDEVMLRMGKQANKRTIQFAMQALLAVFGESLFCTFLTSILEMLQFFYSRGTANRNFQFKLFREKDCFLLLYYITLKKSSKDFFF